MHVLVTVLSAFTTQKSGAQEVRFADSYCTCNFLARAFRSPKFNRANVQPVHLAMAVSQRNNVQVHAMLCTECQLV